MFTLVQLRCFVAVAEDLNLHRAAKRLNMTQPPLTRHIQALEHQVGAMLLDRSSRALRLRRRDKAWRSRHAVSWTKRRRPHTMPRRLLAETRAA